MVCSLSIRSERTILSRSKRSTIYTSNKSFSEWGEVLGDAVMESAVLDRILHHCLVINIRSESYRLKYRRRNALPTERRCEKNE